MTTSIKYYEDLIGYENRKLEVELSAEQMAVILKAHDNGIRALSDNELDLMDQTISTLKDSIRS